MTDVVFMCGLFIDVRFGLSDFGQRIEHHSAGDGRGSRH